MKFWIIAKKEILDITRDRRTMLMMVVLPLLLVPVLLGTVMKIDSFQKEKASEKLVKIRFVGKEYAPELYQAFVSMDEVAMLDQVPVDSINLYLEENLLDAAITVQKNYQLKIDQNSQADIRIQYKGTDSFNIAREKIKSLLETSQEKIITERMARLNLKRGVVQAYNIEYIDVATKQEVLGKMIGGWLPYIFILFGFLGAMYPALDLGSGEKERGTLETILSSPASRFDIVMGKFLVIMLAAFLTAFLALAGLMIGMSQIPDIPPQIIVVVNKMFNLKTMALVMTLVLPVSAFFSATLLGLSIYTAAFISETVRSGIISVSKGQREASQALGLKNNLVMRLIVIPQALRVIIPPLTSQYLNLTKNSSLGIAIGYADLVHGFGGISLNQTGRAIEIMLMVMLTYLTISLTISFFMNLYNKSVQFKGNA